jgi:hypothetical protein
MLLIPQSAHHEIAIRHNRISEHPFGLYLSVLLRQAPSHNHLQRLGWQQ